MNDRELLEPWEKAEGHTPSNGSMSFVPFNEFGGYQHCSCGVWHWVAYVSSAEIGRSMHRSEG